MRVGVISDTHNYFDPKIPLLFGDVTHILHGGDIGSPNILEQLRRMAPVAAVSGNTDEAVFGYPETQVVELGGLKFLVHHIVNPQQPSPALQAALLREKPNWVVFGHTHKPFHESVGGTMFFNPGYAGKSRFGMERSVAVLTLTKREFGWDYYPLRD